MASETFEGLRPDLFEEVDPMEPAGTRRPAPLPRNAQHRKETVMYRGLFCYFPDALAAVARASFIANEQHNPGTEVHWDRSKSGDEYDAMLRHLLEVGTYDDDGIRHATKVAWRALAALQKELEESRS